MKALINPVCVICGCLLAACDKGLIVGQKDWEGYIISSSGGDRNITFSLLPRSFGLIKTELSATVD